jgi:transposase
VKRFPEIPEILYGGLHVAVLFYLGVDVSKSSLAVTLIDQQEKIIWSNKSIPNAEGGFKKLSEQVLKCVAKKSDGQEFNIAVGMEATGVYGEQLAYFLHDNNHEGRIIPYVLNPAAVRSYAKACMEANKNDPTDARVIASFLSVALTRGQVSPWKAPSEEERTLRALSRRREELVHLLISEKNRLEKLNNMASPSEEVVKSVEEHILYLEAAIKNIAGDIDDHINASHTLSKNAELLRSIPGVGEVSTATVLGEAGDISKFEGVKQFTSFVGIAPIEYTSGSSINKRARISKHGNARIRRCLYMATMIAVRVNPVLREFYKRLLERGKSKKVAIVASMRKLLHLIWGVLKNQRKFEPQYSS